MAIVYATPADVAAYMGVVVTTLPTTILTDIINAQELIDYSTLNRIIDYNLNALGTAIEDPLILAAVKNATCAQIEFWIKSGGADSDVINNGSISNFSIGNFSMNYGGTGAGAASMPVLAPRANRYLMLAGLMYRGVWRL
jgi:hypothetical protein